MVALVDANPGIVHVQAVHTPGHPGSNMLEPRFVIINLPDQPYLTGDPFPLHRRGLKLDQALGSVAEPNLLTGCSGFSALRDGSMRGVSLCVMPCVLSDTLLDPCQYRQTQEQPFHHKNIDMSHWVHLPPSSSERKLLYPPLSVKSFAMAMARSVRARLNDSSKSSNRRLESSTSRKPASPLS